MHGIWDLLFENSSIILKEIDLDSNHVFCLLAYGLPCICMFYVTSQIGESLCVLKNLSLSYVRDTKSWIKLKIDIAVEGIDVMSKSGTILVLFICGLYVP